METNQYAVIDGVIVVTRGLVLVIAALGGCMSIFLGWKLYRDGVVSAVEGSVTNEQKWSWTLKAGGPGVFFALFGMILLIYLVRQSVEFEDPVPIQTPAQTSASTSSADRPPIVLAALQPAAPQARERPRVCLVGRRRRVFLDGELSENHVRSALATALVALQARPTEQMSGAQAARIHDAIDTLQEMESSIGPWDMDR